MSHLLKEQYEVHAFDWPGYGGSQRLSAKEFEYSPLSYAKILSDYIKTTGVKREKLLVYATDIGALPALLLAQEEPDLIRNIIVGDFAPLDRPAFMNEILQKMKDKKTAEGTRIYMNKIRDNILKLVEPIKLSKRFSSELNLYWKKQEMTNVDAFYHYYINFTRDQNLFEAKYKEIRTRVKVLWGEKDFLIKKGMGEELAKMLKSPFVTLTGVGHYPHLQAPEKVYTEIQDMFETN